MPETIEAPAPTITTEKPASAAPAAPPSDPWTSIDTKIASRKKPEDTATPEPDATPDDTAAADVKDTDTAPPADGKSLFDELDDLEKPKVEEKPEVEPEEKPEAPEVKPDDKAAEKLTEKAQGPKALREALSKANAEVKAKADQVAALEAKIKAAEGKGNDTTALSERLAAREKELESLRGELSLLKFEASEEYKTKHEQPFNTAAELAKQDISQLTVTDAEGNTRQATWEDFTALWNMPKGKAYAVANDLFGPAAPLVQQHLSELKRLDFMSRQAIESERKTWGDRQRAEQARQAQEREALQAMWVNVNKDLTERVPDYKDVPDDSEAGEIRKEGYALFDAEPRTLQDRVIRDAHVRHRVAAFGVLKLQNARLADEVAKLKKELDGYKASKPTADAKRTAAQPRKEGGSIWEDFPRE